ncbi:MAG TPA: type II glyceraldehyde-3-phosphate dehydrogenase [Nitrosopumilus sp.]|mgnify:CR=1 FL=1|jgi:glyceraldehyde-3-phosphate dehydrogenase (NAD(P))|nr:type II glyceraldehyde-3-phosphate dehydrogenase [Nitrososphaerota archaeon]MDP6326893.1 type II glyceraldehyde-3-phosphate dehydrogenase [Nitrosopumilus sp.]HJM24900.1 type II glyceraldehyde-3-phosphate dehydrogenase [Nitrosopumilus sp.]HJO31465.1 type II glyceraldehyde-3-phosphate dehydrogenase [Nitrosopumilus sp.]|tara:strand:- start:5020 stop:6066 length:1047 start_codon:yes stop_codon:yes gene_type:complete
MKKVFVNGYGSIGSRITSFLKDDPEIAVIGVGKYSPDDKVNDVISRGLDVFVPERKLDDFSNYKISGSIESALDECDLVIDAAPGGYGYKNKKNLYEPKNIPAIYQGGESTGGDESVSDLLFNSRANYDLASGKRHVMQGSCNVTGMGRILEPLREKFGDDLIRFDVTLVRRWADIEQTEKKVSDTIEMTEKPHHGDDVKLYFGKDAPLYVRAIKVPTRQMHLHIMDIRFKNVAPKPSEIHDIFTDEFGVAALWTAKGTKDVREYAQNMGFNFTDTNMIHIHANMTTSIGDTVQMMYSDDQTGIVIPENHMLMQAMLFDKSYEDAFTHTESIFHMKEKKQKLQEHFAK